MIKPEELRLGNLVRYIGETIHIKPYYIEKGRIIQVETIFSGGINDEHPYYSIDDTKIEPIQLTPEILPKAGFKKFADGMLHIDGMNTWRLEYDAKEKAAFWCTDVYKELGHRVYLFTRIEYVHQLQNEFFYLFNKELEIKVDV